MDYYREGQGSLMQCVLTPADPYMPKSNEEIAAEVDKQVGGCGKGEGPPCECLYVASWLSGDRSSVPLSPYQLTLFLPSSSLASICNTMPYMASPSQPPINPLPHHRRCGGSSPPRRGSICSGTRW